MNDRNVQPTSITARCTVNALVKNGRVEDAWDLVLEISKDEDRRQCLNTVVHFTILMGFAVARQPKRFFAGHTEMRQSGVACDTITYNTIIDACARCSRMDWVPQLLVEMEAAVSSPT